MQFRKPVFLSNETSLPEIGGDVANYFTDFEPEKMANFIKYKMQEHEENPDILAQVTASQAAKFTWEKSMHQYIELYRELLQ